MWPQVQFERQKSGSKKPAWISTKTLNQFHNYAAKQNLANTLMSRVSRQQTVDIFDVIVELKRSLARRCQNIKSKLAFSRLAANFEFETWRPCFLAAEKS